MRKVLLATVLSVLLGAGWGAFAQSGQYIGVSIGNPFLQGYYGLEDTLAPDVDARIRLALGIFGGFGINVGADAIFDLGVLDDRGLLEGYAGVGPSLGFGGGSYLSAGYGYFSIDATGLGGVRYAIDSNLDFFAEAGLGLGYFGVTSRATGLASTFGGGFYFPFRLGVGLNFNL
jgi:hypothetical protein